MFDLPPPDPGIEFSIASQGMSKGIAQTDGPQVIARAFARFGSAQVGAQWKNVTSTAAEGEGSIFASWEHKLGAIQLSLGAALKMQTNVKAPTDDKSLELNGAVTRKWARAGLRVSTVYSPNDLGSTQQSLYIEGGPSFDLAKAVRVSANLGRRAREGSPNYATFNAGISIVFGKLTVDARYFDTAESELGEVYRSRGVVSAKLGL